MKGGEQKKKEEKKKITPPAHCKMEDAVAISLSVFGWF